MSAVPRKLRADATPKAALKAFADGLETILASVTALLDGKDPNEWVDQARSPLGRRRHCRLVREGEIKGSKIAGRVFVRRADLDAYIESHVVTPKLPAKGTEESEQAAAEAALRRAQEAPSRRRKAKP